MNYEQANLCFPAGSYSQIDPVKGATYYRANFSSFVRMLPYTEQSSLYNAVNFNLTYANIQNITVGAIQLSILVCPSDTNTAPQVLSSATAKSGFTSNFDNVTSTGTSLQYFTSYGGNQGTFWSNYYVGASGGTQVQTQQNGVITLDGTVTVAASPTAQATPSSTARRPMASSPGLTHLSERHHLLADRPLFRHPAHDRPTRPTWAPRARPV